MEPGGGGAAGPRPSTVPLQARETASIKALRWSWRWAGPGRGGRPSPGEGLPPQDRRRRRRRRKPGRGILTDATGWGSLRPFR
jgi:hypothetical protein